MPTSNSSDYELIDRLAEEFAKRFRDGERPSVQEYCDRYPHLADDLRDMLPALAEVERVKDEVQAPPAGQPPPLREVGDFRIVREVGRGGMGVVYEAEQLSLDRRVALKVLSGISARDARALERFRREARAAARLHHTNIVPVFEVGQDGDTCFYAMQFIQGQGLDRVIDELRQLRAASAPTGEARAAPGGTADTVTFANVGEIAQGLLTGQFHLDPAIRAGADDPMGVVLAPPGSSAVLPGQGHISAAVSGRRHFFDSIARIGQQVAGALAYAHQRGVLHRDIKPSNLLLDESGIVWVTDFGLAKTEEDGLTRPGDVIGTLRYMAPERFQGESDARSDVYALGLTLYELLTLQPGFTARDRLSVIEQVKETEPPSPRSLDPRVPRDLETIVLTAIAKQPRRRYQTAEAMGEDLRRFLNGEPIKARRTGQVERAWLWCRRYPAIASLSATILALLCTLSIGTLIKNAALSSALKDSEDARREAIGANERASAELWKAYLLQARAGRTSGRAGQRFDGLRTLQKAMAVPVPEGRSPLELRNEAIACLSLPDVEVTHELDCPTTERMALAFDPSFTLYARSDAQGHVSVRRVSGNQELFALHQAAGEVSGYGGLTFSPDGRFLCQALGRSPNFSALHVWLLEAGAARLVLQHPHPFIDFAFSGDSRQLAVPRTDGTILILDPSDGKELRRLRSPVASATGLRFHPRLPRLAIVGPERVSILDVTSGLVTAEIATGHRRSSWAAWHPHGHILALTFDDGRVHFFNPESGQPIGLPLDGHRAGGLIFEFNHRGDLLASTDWAGVLRLWDVPTGHLLLETQPPMIYFLLQFSADDQFLAAGFRGERINVLRIASGTELGRIARPPSPTRYVNAYKKAVVDRKGELLGLWLGDGMAIADLGRREETAFLPSVSLHSLAPVGFDPDGGLLIAGEGWFLRWPRTRADGDPESRRFGPPVVRLTNYPWGNELPAMSADDQSILVPAYEAGAHLFRSGQARITLGPQRDVRTCSLSPDGRWAAAADHGLGVIRVWDTEHPDVHRDLLPRPGSVQFSPDGRWLLTQTEDGGGESRLWHVGSWEPGPRFAARWGSAFSADGRMLALNAGYGCVRLVVPDSGTELATLHVPDRTPIAPQCFTPDGRRLIAVGTETGAVLIWDLALIRSGLRDLGLDWSGAPVAAAPMPIPVRTHVTLDPGFLRAREKWTAVLAFFPLYADGYYRRALAYLDYRQTREALADLDLAIRLDPGHADALYQRSLLRRQAGNARAERDDLDRVLETRPGHTEARARRGWLRAEAGQWTDAVADLERVCREEPTNVAYWHWVAMAALGANDRVTYLRACAGIEKLLPTARAPGQTTWLTWTIGLRAGPDFDVAPALEIAERDFRNHPKSYEAARTVSLLRLRAGRLDDALQSLDSAADLQKDVPTVWLMRSQIFARQNETERACEFQARAWNWLTSRPDPGQPATNLDRARWVERLAVTLLAADAEAALADPKK